MIIPQRRVLELAVHVKLASEAVIEAAHDLIALRPRSREDEQSAAWTRAMDELVAMNVELGFMERILSLAARENSGLPQPAARRAR